MIINDDNAAESLHNNLLILEENIVELRSSDKRSALIRRRYSDVSFIMDLEEENTSICTKKRKIIRKCKDNVLLKTINVFLMYAEFQQSMVDLKTYKIVELKSVAKHNKLHITGNKPSLILRITQFFQKNIAAVKIQSCLRRFFVKRSFQLRGPALYDRSMCVNDTDFFTMEPLSEIPFQEFFSYTDEGSFTYGFNVCSFMTLLVRKGRNILNPYNRAKFSEKVIGDMIRLYLYLVILFPERINEEDKIIRTRNQYLQPVNHILLHRGHYYGFGSQNRSSSFFTRNRTNESVPNNTHIRFEEIINDDDTRLDHSVNVIVQEQNGMVLRVSSDHDDFVIPLNEELSQRTLDLRRERHDVIISELEIHTQQYQIHIQNVENNMREIISRPISARIQELFMEIDQLGNYTDIDWFLQLNKRDYFLLYGNLFDTWRYRGRLSYSVKNRICPLGDPFLHVMPVSMRVDEVSEQQLQTGCITVMERLAYTAYDIEDRKLGALHILLALTVVSIPARENMRWLYESMY